MPYGSNLKAKSAGWVVLAVVFTSICLFVSGCDTQQQHQASGDAPSTVTKSLFPPVKASLAQQKMCDEQAAKKFHENGDKTAAVSYFTSRYDPSVNVCYVRVYYMGGSPPTVTDTVYDAFGGRVFANYLWINAQNKKFWEVAPSQCVIHIPGRPDESCKTEEEFNEMVAKYFSVSQ